MKKEINPTFVDFDKSEQALIALINTVDGRFLFNKLKIFNKNSSKKIHTLQDIFDINLNDFISTNGISQKTHDILELLQKKYTNSETIFIDSEEDILFDFISFKEINVPENLIDIEIIDIKFCFSTRLFNILSTHGIKTISELFHSNITKGLGSKTQKELTSFLKNTLQQNFNNIVSVINENIQINNIKDDISLYSEEFLKIEIAFIEDEVDKKIFNKLKPNNILIMKDFMETPIAKFKNMSYIGESLLQYIEKNKQYFAENVEYILEKYNNNKFGIDLFKNYNQDQNIWNIFCYLVNALTDTISIARDKDIFIRKYALKNKKSYTIEELAINHDISKERVRQIIDNYIEILQNIIFEDNVSYTPEDKNLKIFINKDYKDKLKTFFVKIRTFDIISNQKIEDILLEDYNTSILENNELVFELFLAIVSFKTIGRKNVDRFSSDLYYINDNISLDDKQLYVNISNNIYDILKEHILPLDLYDLKIELKRRLQIKKNQSELFNNIVLSVLNIIPEFEFVNSDGNFDEQYYQLRFDKYFNNVSDMVERILYEAGKKLHISEIQELMRNKYKKYSMIWDMSTSTIRKAITRNEKIFSEGKRSVYGLILSGNNENSNNLSLKSIIIEVMRKFDFPMSTSDILKQVLVENADLNKKSIYSIINIMKFDGLIISIDDNKYVLPSLKYKYSTKIIKNNNVKKIANEKTKAEEAYEILSAETLLLEPQKTMLLSKFKKILVSKYNFKYPTANAVSKNINFFIINISDGRAYIDINPNVNFNQKKEKIFNFLTKKAIEELEIRGEQEILLSEFLTFFHKKYNPFVDKHRLYKIFKQTDFFEKKKNALGKSVLLLKATQQQKRELEQSIKLQSNSYDWEVLKKELIKQLEYTFNAQRNTIVNFNFQMPFENLLELYYKFLKLRTGHIAMDRLADDVLPAVERYYINYSDGLMDKMIQKSLALDIEAFILKIIFYVAHADFQIIHQSTSHRGKGLGNYIKKLPLLDPNQYTHNTTLPAIDTQFAQYIYKAYVIRNHIAHLGIDVHENRDWDKIAIGENIKSGLIFSLYALSLYHTQIIPLS